MSTCPMCAEEVPPSIHICPHCSSVIGPPSEPAPPVAIAPAPMPEAQVPNQDAGLAVHGASGSKGKGLIVGAGVAAVIAIGGGVALFLKGAPSVEGPSSPNPSSEAVSAPESPAVPPARPAAGSGLPQHLESEHLVGVVRANQAGMQLCYERAIADGVERGTTGEAPTSLRVDFKLTVGAAGGVREVDTRGDTTQAMRDCFEQEISQWKFPSAQEDSSLAFPAVFKPTVIGKADPSGGEGESDPVPPYAPDDGAPCQRFMDSTVPTGDALKKVLADAKDGVVPMHHPSSLAGSCEVEAQEIASALNSGGLKAYEEKDYSRAQSLWVMAVQLAPHRTGARYNLACAYALAGDAERAIVQLQQLARAGSDGRKRLKKAAKDSDFYSMRDRPDFQALVR